MTALLLQHAGAGVGEVENLGVLFHNLHSTGIGRWRRTGMKHERFQQIKALFEAALDRAPSERQAFLEQACEGDESLVAEVQKLLASHQNAGSFLGNRMASQVETVTIEEPDFGLVLRGRYRIDKELGRGGFGVVYLAHDTHLHEKPVVVKILRQGVDRSGWCEKKFRQECEALARINHPGVVGVTDQGETPDGWPYLVLEFVDGVTLRSVVGEQGMELPRVASLIRQIGQALDAAHDHGVYHRDLKPENIMLRDLGGGQEQPVIIDFGVATVTDCRMEGSPLTRVAGSYPYMAPEQLSGQPEAASDIYALGVIAYEMLTGRRPFDEEDSPVQLFLKQKQGVKVKLGDLRAGVPEAAQRVVSKALSFNPKDRYARALEFGEELARALAGDLDQPSPPPAKLASDVKAQPVLTRRRVAGLAALGTGLLAVVAGRYWVWSPGAPPALQDRTLSYFVMVQKYRDGKPFQEPFRLAGEMLFPAYYRIRLVLSSPQSGYFYLINEAPVTEGGPPSYNVLFPSLAANYSALLIPDQEIQIPSVKGSIVFDEQQGEEKLWMVWSKQSVAELEAVKKWVNPQDKGTIGDTQQVTAVREFLARHFASKPQVQKDEASKRTILRGQGDILVNLMKLEHH